MAVTSMLSLNLPLHEYVKSFVYNVGPVYVEGIIFPNFEKLSKTTANR